MKYRSKPQFLLNYTFFFYLYFLFFFTFYIYTMPGFVLEEAFPLARFNKKIGENDGRLFKVGVNALESILDVTRDSDRSDIADYVAVTVQGEGFKIYNVKKKNKIAYY